MSRMCSVRRVAAPQSSVLSSMVAVGSGVPSLRDEVRRLARRSRRLDGPRDTRLLCGERIGGYAQRYQALMLPDNHILPNVGKPKQLKALRQYGTAGSPFRSCFALNNRHFFYFTFWATPARKLRESPFLPSADV